MTSKALELYVHTQTAFEAYRTELARRLRDEERGQVTTEALAIMVGMVALAGVLAGAGIWEGVANAIADAISSLIDKVADQAD